MPGIDIHLINRLGLPPTVRRLPITQTGCAGGLFALTRAWDALVATTAGHALVVAADPFVPFINPTDTGMDNMIFRAIMSDAAAA